MNSYLYLLVVTYTFTVLSLAHMWSKHWYHIYAKENFVLSFYYVLLLVALLGICSNISNWYPKALFLLFSFGRWTLCTYFFSMIHFISVPTNESLFKMKSVISYSSQFYLSLLESFFSQKWVLIILNDFPLMFFCWYYFTDILFWHILVSNLLQLIFFNVI